MHSKKSGARENLLASWEEETMPVQANHAGATATYPVDGGVAAQADRHAQGATGEDIGEKPPVERQFLGASAVALRERSPGAVNVGTSSPRETPAAGPEAANPGQGAGEAQHNAGANGASRGIRGPGTTRDGTVFKTALSFDLSYGECAVLLSCRYWLMVAERR
jgi:hypothetical protein